MTYDEFQEIVNKVYKQLQHKKIEMFDILFSKENYSDMAMKVDLAIITMQIVCFMEACSGEGQDMNELKKHIVEHISNSIKIRKSDNLH